VTIKTAIKGVALALVVAGVSVSAYYSYGRVNFGGRTGMFFRAVSATGQPGRGMSPRAEMTQPGQSREGGPPPGAVGRGGLRPRRGQMPARGPEAGPGTGQPPSREAGAATAGANPAPAGRGPEGPNRAGPGPGPGGRGNVSLDAVLAYTSILGFVMMVTVLGDRCLLIVTRWLWPARRQTP
jgi:hypothetical protein